MRDRYRALSPSHSPPRRSSRDDAHRQLEESWRPSHSHRSSIQHQPKRDWSKPIGSPNHRYRTWSSPPPPPPTVPGRNAIEPLNRRYPALLRTETDRFVGTGSVRRREFDEPKSVNVRELPEYGESLPRNESAFTKFHRHNQLPNSRAPISNANPTRDERNVILGSSSSPFNEYRNEDFASRKFGGVGLFSDSPGVVPTSMSMEENERYQMDSTRRITTTSYGLVQPRNSLDSAVGMIEGKDDPLFMGSVKQSGTGRILEDYNFLKERYINTHLAERGGEVEENLKDGGRDGVLYGRREVGMEPLDRGELRWVEYGSKRGISGGIGSSGDGLRRMPISYEGLYGAESSPQRHFLEGDLDMDDPEEMMLKRRRFDVEPTQHSQKRRFYNWNGTDNEFYDTVNGTGQWSDEDTETLSLYQDSVSGQSYDRIASRTNNEMIIHGNSYPDIPLSNNYIPESKKNHVRKFVKTSKRDIKSRLEFPGNVKQRLGIPKEMLMRQPVKASKCNIKQRLGPAPCSRNSSRPAGKNHRELPWVKIQEGRCLEHLGGSMCLQGVKSSEVKATKNKNNKKLMKAEPPEDFKSEEKISLKTEPPEDSVEFMQLIQSAHLKYVKVLNENSAIRRKYTEQGGRGPFKCSICGSSNEFVDTLSLAQHAFTSCKGGTRSEHLGFHKALCVLMGWTSADVPSSPWVRQIMPDTQVLSLKEDLIIWPPIVIVHNISIARENPDERMIVSIEGLWDILRGMGFGQWMTNVCRGKAANQSTMVVGFKGTFSGLREAQRLHRFYSENKYGRLEFERIVSGSANESKAETQGVPADSAESVLYGYMGIASDLDKVDFETKKRSVVKSKKEIEAIADASLAPE